jgi:hypothetical protein
MATTSLLRRVLALSRVQAKRANDFRVFWREHGQLDAEWTLTPDGRAAAEADREGAHVAVTMWLPTEGG